jgi:hypothetical protein
MFVSPVWTCAQRVRSAVARLDSFGAPRNLLRRTHSNAFQTNHSLFMPLSIPTTCVATNDSLISESGRFGPGLYDRASRMQPIVALMRQNRGEWQNGLGVIVSAITFERSLPTTVTDPWVNMGASDGTGASGCLPPVTAIAFGQTSRQYQPKHAAIESEDFCIRDIMNKGMYGDLLRAINVHLATRSSWEWFRRFTLDYVSIAAHHWTMNLGGFVDNGLTYSTSALADAGIDFGLLEMIHNDMDREAVDGDGMMYDDSGDQIYPLLISREGWTNLLRTNEAIRADLRYAYQGTKEGMPTLPGPNKFKTFGGFRPMIVPYPRRFIFSGGAYVEVPVWVSSLATIGNKQEINPAWKNATYEEAIVYHPDNYRSLAVNNVKNPAPGWEFQGRNYMGNFEWVNEYHRTCNPDRNIGFFRAVFADAAKPLNPQAGNVIMYKRCNFPIELNNCAYT